MEIRIENLTKIYPNGHAALKGINLTLNEGMIGLLGPNGAGKSTLMKILVTLLDSTSGHIYINGVDISADRRSVRQMTGYLPQDFRFFAKLKTYEFLDYAGRLSGLTSKKERNEQIEKLLTQVGLWEVRNRMANNLSGGMKRRLGIAQSLIGHPRIIIVDEPTTGLDPEERIRFSNLLSEISQQDIIIILSTHIVSDISSTCNQMALINKGEVAFTGSPDALIKHAEGHVWRLIVTPEEYDELKDKVPIITTIPTDDGWEVEVIADGMDKYRGSLIQPNLEHAYVYFLEDKLNIWNL